MPCRPGTDVALLEQRRENGAVRRPGGGNHRWRQPACSELVEAFLIACRIDVVHARPAPTVAQDPDSSVPGIARITGDIQPGHPHSLRQKRVEPLLVGGGIDTVIGNERFHRSFSFRLKISSAALDHVDARMLSGTDFSCVS